MGKALREIGRYALAAGLGLLALASFFGGMGFHPRWGLVRSIFVALGLIGGP